MHWIDFWYWRCSSYFAVLLLWKRSFLLTAYAVSLKCVTKPGWWQPKVTRMQSVMNYWVSAASCSEETLISFIKRDHLLQTGNKQEQNKLKITLNPSRNSLWVAHMGRHKTLYESDTELSPFPVTPSSSPSPCLFVVEEEKRIVKASKEKKVPFGSLLWKRSCQSVTCFHPPSFASLFLIQGLET